MRRLRCVVHANDTDLALVLAALPSAELIRLYRFTRIAAQELDVPWSSDESSEIEFPSSEAYGGAREPRVPIPGSLTGSSDGPLLPSSSVDLLGTEVPFVDTYDSTSTPVLQVAPVSEEVAADVMDVSSESISVTPIGGGVWLDLNTMDGDPVDASAQPSDDIQGPADDRAAGLPPAAPAFATPTVSAPPPLTGPITYAGLVAPDGTIDLAGPSAGSDGAPSAPAVPDPALAPAPAADPWANWQGVQHQVAANATAAAIFPPVCRVQQEGSATAPYLCAYEVQRGFPLPPGVPPLRYPLHGLPKELAQHGHSLSGYCCLGCWGGCGYSCSRPVSSSARKAHKNHFCDACRR